MCWKINSFLHDDRGAVTVDWVILTAAVVAIAAGALVTVHQETISLSVLAGEAIPKKVSD